jgi:hypothetical protein
VNFRVRKTLKIYRSAYKHGVAKRDIEHVLRYPIRVIHKDDETRLYLGGGLDADLLEVITTLQADGVEIAVHAMKMRSRYATLLPRE